MSHKFWSAVFSFSIISKYSLISSVTCNLIRWCLIYTTLWIFHFCFCYCFLTCTISFKICWDLICGLRCGLSWKMYQVHLRSTCILFLFDRVFCICLLGLVDCVKSSISLLFFCLVVLTIIENAILKPPNIIIEFSISHFNSVSFCLQIPKSHFRWWWWGESETMVDKVDNRRLPLHLYL